MASEVDIVIDSGTSFSYHFQWTDSTVAANPGVDLKKYVANMDVRRSVLADKKLLSLHGSTLNDNGSAINSGITHGGSTGEFVNGATFSGIPGVGGIFLNTSAAGGTGFTGGIRIEIDATSTANIPAGRHFYDVQVQSGGTGGVVTRLLEGRFEIRGSVTR